VIGALTAIPSAWTLLVKRRFALCSGVFVIWGGGSVAGYFITQSWPLHEMAARMKAGMVFGLPASIGSLLLVAVLLEFCDRVVGPGARLRVTLESLTVASGIFVPLWVLVLRPGKPVFSWIPGTCVPVMVASALASVVAGLAVVIVVRSQVDKRRVALRCAAAALMAAGTTLVAGAACYESFWLVLLGTLMVPVAGWLWNARANVPVATTPARADRSPSSGLATALPPVLALSMVALYGYTYEHGIDVVTAVVGVANGFFLVGRQYLAFVDLRAVHARLSDSESHYRELAHTDPLTGLANRRGLLRSLYVEATSGRSCVLLTLDLDGFKSVNDMRGHDAGDAVLIEVGQRLRLNLRPPDLAARLGGDEFAVLMSGRPADAIKVAERLLGVLRRPYHAAGGPIYLSASMGLAGCATADSIHSLLRNADLAQRAAKMHGKNRVELYDETFDRVLRRRSAIEHEMRYAIDKQQLVLVFQPVVALPSVRPVGAEALLRWNHPELGNVGPLEFIPIAEETGQIEALGAWVLHEACRQLSRWLNDGHDVWVSVNVSPRELHSSEYLNRVRDVLRAHRVPPSRLVLEVTEHAVAVDVDEFKRVLASLRQLGVRIALDDFGAGYSNLGALREIPVDILKIDQGLVSDVDLVDVAARIGQRLGLQVIAEGISDQAHHRLVSSTGCPYGQGFLFGRGVPAEHLEAMLVSMPPLPSPTAPGSGALGLGGPASNGLSAPLQSRQDTTVPTSGSS
jgi:diguanylate cyclase (GGDEF)-like protein